MQRVLVRSWEGVFPAAEAGNGRMFTVAEAARMLSAHPNSVRRWADMGLLPSYRRGRRGDRRFHPDDLSTFMAS